MKKIILWIGIGLVCLLFGLFIFVQVAWDKTYDAPYPEITASTDSALIARGKYLAYGPAHCATCHVPFDKMEDIDKGIEVPLIGGLEFDIPPGIFRATNITSDTETGIGKYTDAELARALRHSVSADGGVVFAFMPFQETSDEDLTAIISFLRSTEPVHNVVPPTELKFLGKALMAFGMIKPEGPKKTPPKAVEKGITVEYGKYLSNNMSNCLGCHTDRDMMTGEFVGEDYGGGLIFPQDAITNYYGFISPNLTKDPETGLLADWTEEMFIQRFRAGRIHKSSPMAWGSYSRMDETDLRAMYIYLQSVTPVKNQVVKTVFLPDEEMPE